jgi:hypothetical protein
MGTAAARIDVAGPDVTDPGPVRDLAVAERQPGQVDFVGGGGQGEITGQQGGRAANDLTFHCPSIAVTPASFPQ